MLHRRFALLLTLALFAFPGASRAADEGELCLVGQSQSPIAIDTRTALPSELRTPNPDYRPGGAVLWNDHGHTVQVQFAVSAGDPGPGDSTLMVDGVRFQLVQLHFHRPGEHPIDKTVPAMELHLVHRDASDRLAVLAVPIKVDDNAPDQPAIARLWANLPEKKDERRQLPSLFDPSRLLPSSRIGYRYPGSLTTGTCAQSVRWTVLADPLVISKAQKARYDEIFKEDYARPAQPANGRIPLRSVP